MEAIIGAAVGGVLVILGNFVNQIWKSKIERQQEKDNERSRLDGLINTFIYYDIYSWRCSYLREYYLNQFNHNQLDKYYDLCHKYEELNEEYQNKSLETLQIITDCISSLGYLYGKNVSKIINNLSNIGFSDETDVMLERVMEQTPEENSEEYLSTLKEIREYSDKYKIEFCKVREDLKELNIDVREDTSRDE